MRNWGILFFLLAGIAVAGQAQTPDTVRSGAKAGPRRSPTGALLRSVAFPGGGQLYNRKYFKALLIGGTEIGFGVSAGVQWHRRDMHKRRFETATNQRDSAFELSEFQRFEDSRNIFFWLVAGTIFYSMLDAYVDAHLSQYTEEGLPPLSLDYKPEERGWGVVSLRLRFSW